MTPIVEHASAFTSVQPTGLQAEYLARLTDAWTLRRWRVDWLPVARVACLVQGAGLGIYLTWSGHSRIVLLSLIVVVTAWYCVAVPITWRRWNTTAQNAFLRNRRLSGFAGFGTFLLAVLSPAVVLTGVALAFPTNTAEIEGFCLYGGWGILVLSVAMQRWAGVLKIRKNTHRFVWPRS